MTAVPQPPAAELLDQLAQQEHHGASAEGCTVCRLVTALRAVLALADELAAKCPPDDWGSGGIEEAIQADTGRAFRTTVAAALTDGAPR